MFTYRVQYRNFLICKTTGTRNGTGKLPYIILSFSRNSDIPVPTHAKFHKNERQTQILRLLLRNFVIIATKFPRLLLDNFVIIAGQFCDHCREILVFLRLLPTLLFRRTRIIEQEKNRDINVEKRSSCLNFCRTIKGAV